MNLVDLFLAVTVPVLTLVVIFGKDLVRHEQQKAGQEPGRPALTFHQAKTMPAVILVVFGFIHYVLILEVARHVTQPFLRFVYGALLALPVYTMYTVAVLLYYLVLRFKNRKAL
ncbi:MAG: hypothetical protein A2X32_07395 [Elusimicrobia bacterium GWC2_64_44]|nr:MAG: hypothetical protein A2X32_07395 [Elusimicrobia bacterium GWC2_64_44]